MLCVWRATTSRRSYPLPKEKTGHTASAGYAQEEGPDMKQDGTVQTVPASLHSVLQTVLLDTTRNLYTGWIDRLNPRQRTISLHILATQQKEPWIVTMTKPNSNGCNWCHIIGTVFNVVDVCGCVWVIEVSKPTKMKAGIVIFALSLVGNWIRLMNALLKRRY